MKLIATFIVCLAAIIMMAVTAAAVKPPQKLVFQTRMGNVTFNHAAHLKRAKFKCKTCHTKLFPQSRAPIGFKKGMHMPAVKAKTSCGACHNPDGPGFQPKGNCKKCHVK